MTVTLGEAREWSESMRLVGGGLVRQVLLAHQMGVPEALGMTLAEWRQEYMGGTIQLPREERRAVVAELTTPLEEGGPDMSTREIADILGVGHATVARAVSNETRQRRSRTQRPAGVVSNETVGASEPDVQAVNTEVEGDSAGLWLGQRIWDRMLELSECRVELKVSSIGLREAIGMLPADQLEGMDQVAGVLIDWLDDVRREAQAGRAKQPVKLGEQRIKRGKGWAIDGT